MASKNMLKHIGVVFIALVPIIYVFVMWEHIPQTIALHYDISGKPDRYGDRFEFLLGIALLAGINLATYLFMANMDKINPKQAQKLQAPIFNIITIGVVVFLTIVGLIVAVSGIYPDAPAYERLMIPVIGLLYIFLGNFMHSIKPNRHIGIRFPWTLRDEDNWKHTHRMGSKLFFVAGILITIGGLALPLLMANIFFISVTLILLLSTAWYSYSLHLKSKKQELH